METDSWISFFPDLIIALLSSFFTVMIALVTYRINLQARENNALRSLVTDLSSRRALALIVPKKIRRAKYKNDYVRANTSILLVKDEVKRVRNSVRAIPALEETLRAMTRACNIYLEDAAKWPSNYQFYLMELRDRLNSELENIHKLRPAVHIVSAGGSAFE